MRVSHSCQMLRLAVPLALVFLIPSVCRLTLHAHGDVHERIDALTAVIKRDPTNALRYLDRAELWRVDGSWTKALADLDRAAELEPGLTGLDLARGRVCLEAGRHREAVDALTRYLGAHPGQAVAWVYRGRARAGMGDVAGGVLDLDRALEIEPNGDPEAYLERARLLVGEGRPQWERALVGLEEGLRRLGPVVALEVAAIDLETDLGRFDEALGRVDRVMAKLPRKEAWLVRKAEILARAGRPAASKTAFEEVLRLIDRLPARLRKLQASRDLEARARAGLARLPGTAPEGVVGGVGGGAVGPGTAGKAIQP